MASTTKFTVLGPRTVRLAVALGIVAVFASGSGPAVTKRAVASTGAGGLVQVMYTSYNFGEGSYRLSPQPSKALSPLSNNSTMTVLVDPSITYQTYQGFGSTFEDTTIYHLTRLSAANREAALQTLFSEANGNNFNLMRTTIGCPDFCRDFNPSLPDSGFWTYDDNNGTPDPSLANFSIQHDVTNGRIGVLQDALRINPDLQIFASVWSPPGWMKTNGHLITSDQNCVDLPANANTVQHGAATGSAVDYYPALANYFVKYIQAYKAYNIPIAYVSLQNEPDIARSYPTNCFTPQQEADFARVLKSTFDANDIKTKIWGLDDNQHTTFPHVDPLLADPATNTAIDGVGFHNYEGTKMWAPIAVQAQWPDKTVHLTEITQGANKLIEYFRAGVSSYNGWGMMFELLTRSGVLYNASPSWWQDKPVNTSDPDASMKSLISPRAGDSTNYDLNEYYYIFGQFSRFLQPGAKRIDSPDRMGSIYNVAFKNPDGTVVIVVVNRPNTRYINTVEPTAAQTIRIATPDGEFYDTVPGDTIATYKLTSTTGDALSRSGWIASATNTDGGYTPTQAIDGQSTTHWTSGINQSSGQSFTLDLGAQRTFDQVTLNQMELSNDFPAGYSLTTSTDGTSWSGSLASGAGTPGFTNITFASQTARYIRITLTTSAPKWWSIGDIGVFNSSSGLLPKLSGSASASTSGSGSTPSAALDGSMETAWTTGAAQAPGQWFQLDLGSPRTFNAIELDSGQSSGDYPRVFSVQVSTDGVNWGSAVAQGNGQSHEQYVNVASRTARYIRVTLMAAWSSNPWTIREFRVLNVSPPTLPTSGWTASASSTWTGTSTSNVFDGSTTTRWSSGLAQADGQWFQIDMKGDFFVTGIQLDTAGFTGDYGRCTRIEVSLDAQRWRTVADVVGIGQNNGILWPVANARYIRVNQTCTAAANYWSIAEVAVYTVPGRATFGASLSHSGWSATTNPAGIGSPALGIDGQLNTRWTTGAAPTGSEWYQVDLGATRTFRGVQLNAAGPVNDLGGDYPRAYEVWVSNGGAWTKVAAGTGYEVVTTVLFPPQTARYVHVKQLAATSGVWWSVAEFNVLT